MGQYPKPKNERASAAMRGNRKDGTRPEFAVRRWLRKAGVTGYRLHWKIKGRPDVAFPGRKIAVFVHGCFWHGCVRCKIALPRHNAIYWRQKILGNSIRDAATTAALKDAGWQIVVLRECEIQRLGPASIGPVLRLLRRAGGTGGKGGKA
jgi:DNA mismatch endonuclease, patch repair protein